MRLFELSFQRLSISAKDTNIRGIFNRGIAIEIERFSFGKRPTFRGPSFSETDEPKETREVDARLNFCFPDTVRIYRYSVQVARQPLASTL